MPVPHLGGLRTTSAAGGGTVPPAAGRPPGRPGGLGAEAGLHLLFTLPGREEKDLVVRAARAGYRVRGLGEYCVGNDPLPGTLVLGFAGLPEERAGGAVGELKRAFFG